MWVNWLKSHITNARLVDQQKSDDLDINWGSGNCERSNHGQE
jgi:hypothetical protein